MSRRDHPRWRRWSIRLAATIAVVGAAYIFWIGPAHDEYLMSAGKFEKTFAAGSWGQPADDDFTVRGCRRITGVPGRPDGLKAMEWQPDGALVVRYTVAENCAAPFAGGGYGSSGNTLCLNYRLKYWTSERAACMCAYDLEYRINDVPRADYVVQARPASQ